MIESFAKLKVLVRGGGEMATGIAWRLHQCHFKVLITEVPAPTAVRRTVAFAEAVYQGCQTVEGVRSVKIKNLSEVSELWEKREIPMLVDPEASVRSELKPDVIVDAIMAKKLSKTAISDAPLVIGVGPGFRTGIDVHAVVESNRGYHLGRVIWNGSAEPYTGMPAAVGGHSEARVLRASRNGNFKAARKIGDMVQQLEVVGEVGGVAIMAQIPGVVRGMLQDGVQVQVGMKVGDIDPRGEREYCYSISDKARAIGGGVLEGILHVFGNLQAPAK